MAFNNGERLVQGVVGSYAIIALLSIIAGIATWTLKTVIEVSDRHSVLEEKVLGIQERTAERLSRTDAEIGALNQSVAKLNDVLLRIEIQIATPPAKH